MGEDVLVWESYEDCGCDELLELIEDYVDNLVSFANDVSEVLK